jgi:pyruvate/2-oxoglutarate dehydrogenase complex dihydrolipoamide dehydrogenase (E3) component
MGTVEAEADRPRGDAVFDVIVLGGGPAGVAAALRARELGATVALVERDRLGGMCVNDGCVPTRALAKAARLVRDSEQLADYGLFGDRPVVDFRRLLATVAATVQRVHQMQGLPARLEHAGVHLVAGTGTARFADAHTIAVDGHGELRAEQIIVCVGGHARRLPFPGSELAFTHSDVWALDALPGSVVVVGGSATGCQLASVLAAFGSRVTLLEAAGRLLGTEDEAVSEAVGDAFRRRGIEVATGIERIERLERTGAGGLRLHSRELGEPRTRDTDAVLLAVGWPGNLEGLGLEAAGIRTDRGYIAVDDRLRTSVPNVYAAGDVSGRMMLVQTAEAEARFAAENALAGAVREPWPLRVVPHGGFTDPEYAGVGLAQGEAEAEADGCVVAVVRYADLERAVIDRHTEGFAKLLVSRSTRRILGAHVVGEQAVEVVQLAAATMAAEQPVERLADLQLAYPTFTAIIGLAAREAARQLGVPVLR